MESPKAGLDSPKTTTHLLAGGALGLVLAFTLQPLDLLKTRLQQPQGNGARPSLAQELRKLRRLSDLWRGALPSTLRTSVGAGLYFTILSQTRQYLAGLKATENTHSLVSVLPRLSHVENLATGFVVRAVVGVATMPITVVKTRFELSYYTYGSVYEGFAGVYGDGPGRWRNFFRGTKATLARDCPYAGLYVLFYEGFKNDLYPRVTHLVGGDLVMVGVNNLLAAVSAACVATTLTAPFDAIKTRLQLVRLGQPTLSFVAVARQLLLEPGGYRNLFSGVSLRLGRKALSAGISWCLYEELLKYFST